MEQPEYTSELMHDNQEKSMSDETASGHLQITTRADRCCASGQCALAMPEVFDQDAVDGTVVLRRQFMPATALRDLQGVAARCPTQAISVR